MGSVLSTESRMDRGTGGMFTSKTPSSICSTTLIEGRLSSSSWMHQNVTLQILVTSSMLASLFNLLSSRLRMSPPTITTLAAKQGKNLKTSALAVTATPDNHSGARYPLVPLKVVKTLLKSRPTSFARPKSVIFGQKSASRRMFSGFMSHFFTATTDESRRTPLKTEPKPPPPSLSEKHMQDKRLVVTQGLDRIRMLYDSKNKNAIYWVSLVGLLDTYIALQSGPPNTFILYAFVGYVQKTPISVFVEGTPQDLSLHPSFFSAHGRPDGMIPMVGRMALYHMWSMSFRSNCGLFGIKLVLSNKSSFPNESMPMMISCSGNYGTLELRFKICKNKPAEQQLPEKETNMMGC
ncbi:hypothetical protein Ccrd_026377, partial [Cynara cardunculus var. scolymus]